MKKFAIEYRYAGKAYSMDLYAEDFDDASRRLRAAYFNGVPYEVVASIPVSAPIGIFNRIKQLIFS